MVAFRLCGDPVAVTKNQQKGLIFPQVADDADDEGDQPEVRSAQRELITKQVQPSGGDAKLEKQVGFTASVAS